MGKKVTEMASSYATSIEESQSLMSGMQSDMILKFEDSGRSLLGFVAPFDVSWLDNVTLSNDISFTEGKEGILMKVLLNDNKICTLEYYLDPDSQDIYMRILNSLINISRPIWKKPQINRLPILKMILKN